VRPNIAETSASPDRRPVLLLSVDFEDWHQLVRRRVGVRDWHRPGPALAGQTDALLALLDELGVHATFFVLGMAARSHPELVASVAAAGHEIGCHGDAHVLVHRQTPEEFAADLRAARATIRQLTGAAPVGYRAPAFSLPLRADWPYRVLADEGFQYDASRHDTGRRPDGGRSTPYPLELEGGRVLWEFPVAVWRTRGAAIGVGGASYWTTMPTQLVLHGLGQAGPQAGVYLHPQELDPRRLRPELPRGCTVAQRAQASFRALQRNAARRRAPGVLRAIAEHYRLIPYGEAHARLTAHAERAGGVAASS
jgi:polysaccharide deacetylase family protein (PEP-CTERM system associated)